MFALSLEINKSISFGEDFKKGGGRAETSWITFEEASLSPEYVLSFLLSTQ